MEKKYINRFNSFCRCLDLLKLSEGEDPEKPFVLPGTVQNYNLTFDLSWKLMKDILLSEYGISDFATGSPKETIRTAASVGLINDDKWIDMLNARNNLIHDYDGLLANKLFDEITRVYCKLFMELQDKIQNSWL